MRFNPKSFFSAHSGSQYYRDGRLRYLNSNYLQYKLRQITACAIKLLTHLQWQGRLLCVTAFVIIILYNLGFDLPMTQEYYNRYGEMRSGRVLANHANQLSRIHIVVAGKDVNNFSSKSDEEFVIEQMALSNRRKYANIHGYSVGFKGMGSNIRFFHNWRRGWESCEYLAKIFQDNPQVEWIWWTDSMLLVKNMHVSLEDHIFVKALGAQNRSISVSVDMVAIKGTSSLDYTSFLIHKSDWSRLILDVWWDNKFWQNSDPQWKTDADAFSYIITHAPSLSNNICYVPRRELASLSKETCERFKADSNNVACYHKGDFAAVVMNCYPAAECLAEITVLEHLA